MSAPVTAESETVERVARAIWETGERPENRPPPGIAPRPWEAAPDDLRPFCYALARAAIAAMPEPWRPIEEAGAYEPCPFDERLARTAYLVLPKLAIQAMPIEWRKRLAALLDEMEAGGIETPQYVVLRDEPEYSRSVLENEDDIMGPLDRVEVFRPDPWADYRHGRIQRVQDLCPGFSAPSETTARRAIAAMPEPWRPIAEAPRDTPVLVGRAGEPGVFDAWWGEGGNGWGWVDGATDNYGDLVTHDGLTHFQPLPAPPAQGDKADGGALAMAAQAGEQAHG